MHNEKKIKDRLERLKRCCCPIHGLFMSQTDEETEITKCCGNQVLTGRVIVSCPRKDCEINAFVDEINFGAKIFPEFEHLLKP